MRSPTLITRRLRGASGRARTLAALGLLVALILGFWWQAFIPGRAILPLDLLRCTIPWSRVMTCYPAHNKLITDKIRGMYPLNHFTAEGVRGGEVPLWDPYIYSGFPNVGIGESQIFYPLSVLYFAWDNDPKAGDLSIVVHLLIGAVGAYAFLRELGARRPAALLAGVTWTLNLVVTITAIWNGSLDVLVWGLPILAAVERALHTRSIRWTLAAGGLTGMMLLGGHPERMMHLLIVIGPYILVRAALLSRGLTGRARWQPLLVGGLVLLIGAGLAVVKLWPEMELIARGVRVARTPAELAAMLVRYQPVTFLVPKIYGDPTAGNYWWFNSNYNDTTYYFGLIPLFLACMLPWLRRDMPGWFFFGIMALGAVLPYLMVPLREIVAVPGLAHGLPYRLPFVSVMAGSVGGALALDALLRGRRPPAWLSFAVAAGMVAFVLWRVLKYWDAMVYRGEYVATQLALFALFLAIAWWLTRARAATGVIAAVALAATAADLFAAGVTYNSAQTVANKLYPVTPSIQYLLESQAAEPSRYMSANPVRVFPPNMGSVYGLEDLNGFMSTVDQRYGQLLEAAGLPDGWAEPRGARALSLLNVRHVLESKPVDPPPGAPYRLVYDQDLTIYEHTAPLPRVFVVHEQRVAADGDQALSWLLDDAALDLRRVAVTEAGNAPGPDLGSDSAGDRAGVTAHGLNTVDIATHTQTPGLLVLDETWYPGWQATVDGQPAPVWRVDYVLRGAVVPAGDHHVQFVFRPLSVYGGLVVSLATLLCCVVALGWSFRNHSIRNLPQGSTVNREMHAGKAIATTSASAIMITL